MERFTSSPYSQATPPNSSLELLTVDFSSDFMENWEAISLNSLNFLLQNQQTCLYPTHIFFLASFHSGRGVTPSMKIVQSSCCEFLLTFVSFFHQRWSSCFYLLPSLALWGWFTSRAIWNLETHTCSLGFCDLHSSGSPPPSGTSLQVLLPLLAP